MYGMVWYPSFLLVDHEVVDDTILAMRLLQCDTYLSMYTTSWGEHPTTCLRMVLTYVDITYS